MASLQPTPTQPSTTESATNRIDLDSLSTALNAAGIQYQQISGTDIYIWAPSEAQRDWPLGEQQAVVAEISGDVKLYGCDEWGAFVMTDTAFTALDIINQHTTRAPRRSRDQAGMAGEENV